MRVRRILYLIATWPDNDRDDYDKVFGAQFPIPAWAFVVFFGLLIYLLH